MMSRAKEEIGRISLASRNTTIKELMDDLAKTLDYDDASDHLEQILHRLALRGQSQSQFGKERAKELTDAVAVISGILAEDEMMIAQFPPPHPANETDAVAPVTSLEITKDLHAALTALLAIHHPASEQQLRRAEKAAEAVRRDVHQSSQRLAAGRKFTMAHAVLDKQHLQTLEQDRSQMMEEKDRILRGSDGSI
jgi:hypothetical protein